MKEITKQESELLRKKFPNVYIVTVGKFAPARKKTRFVEETHKVMKCLDSMREEHLRGVYFYGTK